MEPSSAEERREALKAVYAEASGCLRCPLAQSRTTVVFGAGHADADLMFVGEAPGAQEDRTGLPFVGQAGKLLTGLLEEIGLERGDVFVANVVKCRPPQNRDPHPHEIEACRNYLERQVALIRPRLVCSLGNFATKLLRGDPTGITRVHGQPEDRALGGRAFRLYPLYHPAAALYTRSMLDVLREDFARIPALLELAPPASGDQPEAEPDPAVLEHEDRAPDEDRAAASEDRAPSGGRAAASEDRAPDAPASSEELPGTGPGQAPVRDPARPAEPPQLGLF